MKLRGKLKRKFTCTAVICKNVSSSKETAVLARVSITEAALEEALAQVKKCRHTEGCEAAASVAAAIGDQCNKYRPLSPRR